MGGGVANVFFAMVCDTQDGGRVLLKRDGLRVWACSTVFYTSLGKVREGEEGNGEAKCFDIHLLLVHPKIGSGGFSFFLSFLSSFPRLLAKMGEIGSWFLALRV